MTASVPLLAFYKIKHARLKKVLGATMPRYMLLSINLSNISGLLGVLVMIVICLGTIPTFSIK